jgi:hypothetical protein
VPDVGQHDHFEQQYIARLKSLLIPLGLVVSYEHDRAALDLGIHLYEGEPDPDWHVGRVRVWFQCKGLRSTTVNAAEFAKSEQVAISGLRVADVQYWYGLPEPAYLVIYIEATDEFLAEDVRNLVDAQGGMPDLARRVGLGQIEMTLHVPTASTLDRAIEKMPHHRSLRLDGPDWRGRPLGHRFDPLRSQLSQLVPSDYQALVGRLLEVHEFRASEVVDLTPYLEPGVGTVTTTIGKLYLTYEWTNPLFSEFGYDAGSDFRLESAPEHAHGEVMVVVHSDVSGPPEPRGDLETFLEDLRTKGIGVLVFFNSAEADAAVFGGWRRLFGLAGTPQGLGSLAFNVLTATSVYLEFLERLTWDYVNYL